MGRQHAYLGIDVGSISTKGVIIDKQNNILASAYIWTQGDPIGAVKKLVALLEKQFDKQQYKVVATGTTGSARKLVGVIVGATMVKNEITAHAVGTTTFYPEVRTILEIGGQDSKIILVENGVAVDYAMNTLCAAGTGAFLSSQAKRLGIEVEDIGEYALKSKHPTQIAARCTVFAESDLVHKIQMGHPREDIIAGVCNAVAANYMNNVGKGKKIASPVVFQGGVSKNKGVVAAFEKLLGCDVIVDQNGHLMGALGVLIAGSAAIVGHMFPLYFGFKGGKGILVGATMIAVFDWRVFCVAIAAFIVLVAITKWVSLGSIVGSCLVPVMTLYFHWGEDMLLPMMIILVAMVTAVVYMHRSNIVRIAHGEENKFSLHSKKEH